MAPLGPDDFFLPSPNSDLSQGDIVLVPTVVLWAEQRSALDFSHVPHSPALGDTVAVPLWDSYAETGAPLVNAEARWSPAMVISHSCDLDKEFNREYQRLVDSGVPPAEAHELASADEQLDRFLVVSPLLPYDEAPLDQRPGIKSGSRTGYMPIAPHELFDNEDLFVDLRRMTTADRLLVTKYATVASLNETAAGVLRFKISEAFSSRALAVVAEIEALTGRTVERTETLPQSSKSACLVLHLDNGETLRLEIRKPMNKVQEALTRLWR